MNEPDSAPLDTLLDDTRQITFFELQRASGLSAEEIDELVEVGVFEHSFGDRQTWAFSARCISQARTALRLRNDFELNTEGIALALTYLDRIHALEARLREVECQLLK